MAGAAQTTVRFEAGSGDADMRLDAFVARHLHWRSRASIASLCAAGDVKVNGSPAKKSRRLVSADVVEVIVPVKDDAREALAAVVLQILHEDEDLVVVDKPPGVAVHPASTCQQVNMLRRLDLEYSERGVCPAPTPSIIHRIDRNTSGVVAFCKQRDRVAFYTQQFEQRTAMKTYTALVHGETERAGTVNAPLIVGDKRPVRVGPEGKTSRTAYRQIRYRAGLSLVELRPSTGRKHQIRVHLASIGHPIVFDDLYGRVCDAVRWPTGARVMLHASSLVLRHRNGEQLRFEAPMPADLERMWELGYAGTSSCP